VATSTPTSTATAEATEPAEATLAPTPMAGTLLPVTAVGSAGTTGEPALAVDGDLGSVWQTLDGAAANAEIVLDTGAVGPIAGIRWQFAQDGGAPAYSLALSDDGANWRSLGRWEITGAGAWQSVAVNEAARYVRLTIENSAGVAVLGYLAEIEVYGEPRVVVEQTATPTPTEVPETATVEPSATAMPTETAVPPTETPVPEPTETAVPPTEAPPQPATETPVPPEPPTEESTVEASGS
jgi:hypothetical protein